MKKTLILITLLASVISAAAQPAGRELWNSGWSFTKDGSTRTVNLPHDWGVEGEFNQEFPGETGKLPWWGKARYGKTLEVTEEDLQKDIRL